MQAQCMTWLFAYFDVSWVVHGGPRSQVSCSGRDAIEVRRGQGHMQPSLNQILTNSMASKELIQELIHQVSVLLCVVALI